MGANRDAGFIGKNRESLGSGKITAEVGFFFIIVTTLFLRGGRAIQVLFFLL